MGKYQWSLLESPYNEHEAYENWDTGYYMYFSNGWLVGSEIGGRGGLIYQQNQVSCPFFAPTGWWYAHQGNWYEDETLTVRCIE